MKLFPYVINRIKSAWREMLTINTPFQIYTHPLVTPKRLYQDCKYVIDTEDRCNEHGEIYYLREDVREKTKERRVADYYGDSDVKHEIGFINNEMQVYHENGFLPFSDFINHPKLISALLKIVNTPFLVMIYDLDPDEKSHWGWYKHRISKLKNVSPGWVGKPHAEAVLKELERIGAELRTFCGNAMEYNSVIIIHYLGESVCYMRKNDMFQANESVRSAKTAHAAVLKNVRAVNKTLRHVRNIVDEAGLHTGHEQKLQRAGEQLALITLPRFKA